MTGAWIAVVIGSLALAVLIGAARLVEARHRRRRAGRRAARIAEYTRSGSPHVHVLPSRPKGGGRYDG